MLEIKLTIKKIMQNKTIIIVGIDVFINLFLSLILFKKGSKTKNDEIAPILLTIDVVHVFKVVFFSIGKRRDKSVYFIERIIRKTDKIDKKVTLITDVIKTLLKPFFDINKAVPIKNTSEYQIGVFINIFV